MATGEREIESESSRSARLLSAIEDTGYTPAKRDARGLLALFDDVDDDVARKVEASIARLGEVALEPALAAYSEGSPKLRARVCRLIGRLEADVARRVDFLVTCLEDADARTRRIAVVALGKAGSGNAKAEKALVDLARGASDAPLRRAIAEALGKVGSLDAIATVEALVAGEDEAGEGELGGGRRVEKRAALMLKRTHHRDLPSSIRGSHVPSAPLTIVLHARGGLESYVVDELRGVADAIISGRGLVTAPWTRPLADLFRVRTAMHFAIALPPVERKGGAHANPADLGATVVEILTSKETTALLRELTEGAIRYRLDFAGKGHRRALVWDTAVAVAERQPLLENDPTNATWEVVVYERKDMVFVELVPKSLVDPRFDYREGDVPAASHPTIAAALARLGGVRPGDIVWDPFVGSGTELVERATLGSYVGLVGTDIDERAVAIAQRNIEKAGIRGATIMVADATEFNPGEVSLVLTNPPLGKRVRFEHGAGEFVDRFLRNVSKVLAPNGRMAWVSPNAKVSNTIAARVGLFVEREHDVDMGGFTLSMQRLGRKKKK